MRPSLRRRVHEIVDVGGDNDRTSRLFDVALITLIFLNVTALVLETVHSLYVQAPVAFDVFEASSVMVFTLEYAFRIWSCVEDPRYAHPVWGRLRFAMTPMAFVDLIAILPFYLIFLGADLRFARSFRLLRMLRVAKLTRYVEALESIKRALASRSGELVITIAVIGLLLVGAAGMMFFVEHKAQPEAFSSIPAAMWWAVATLTTVGYGDVYPVTAWGRLLGAVIAILGVGLVALPAGIISGAFLEELQQKRRAERRSTSPPESVCPHCGERLDRAPEDP